MRIFTFIAGVVCLFAALFDAFQTIILPRRATGRFRLTRIFFVVTWRPWAFFTTHIHDVKKRVAAFSSYGPMSLIFPLAMWAVALTLGFALIYHALGSPFTDPLQGAGFKSDLYVSGTTLLTLGL